MTEGRQNKIHVLYLMCRDSFEVKVRSDAIVWPIATVSIFLGLWLKAGAVLSLLAISAWALAAVVFVTTWMIMGHAFGYLFHVAVEARIRGVSFWAIRSQPFYSQVKEAFVRRAPKK